MRRRLGSVLVIGGMLLTVGLADAAAALSKDEYIVAADNICAQADELRLEVYDAVFASLPEGAEPTFDQLSEFVAGVQPITQQQIDGLRDLPAPSGDEKKLNKLYKAVQKGLDKIVADPNILLAPKNPYAKADKLGQKYGFEVCGTGGG